MTIKKVKSKLILVVDNTLASKIKFLEDKQKKYINIKLKVQEERKLINKLLKQYEDNIIKIENKLNQYRRKQHGQRGIKQTGNTRPGRHKAKTDNA
tara:strand:+ start:28 stop:315 length:288 start_codon:yes stop_codon:yes gene_type:complete